MTKNTDENKLHRNGDKKDNYWNDTDSSELLEKGENVELVIVRPIHSCTNCNSERVRVRMVELPILEGTIIFKKVRIVFCPDCNSSELPKSTVEELIKRVELLGLQKDFDTFNIHIRKGLEFFEKSWAEKKNARKVMSFYFPTKQGTPGKAQIALTISDPLYPVLRSLTSEDLRKLLNVDYYEDLVENAKEQTRSISQYLKYEISKRALEDRKYKEEKDSRDTEALNDIDESSKTIKENESKIISLYPKLISDQELKEEPLVVPKLAASTDQPDKELYLIGANKEFVGQLDYDWVAGNLFLNVLKNNIGIGPFEVQIVFTDDSLESKKDILFDEDRILLIDDTKYKEEDIKEIILKLE